jgi:hypothetical protein
LSSARVSSGALLPGQATKAWAMGASADDVPTLSSVGRVIRAMDTTTDALPPRMVRTYSGFWPRRLLCRRQPLRTRRPPVGQKGLESGKLDSLECQTGPSGFPGSTVAPGLQHELEVSKSGSSTDQSRGSQGQTRPRSETSADDKAKSNVERNQRRSQ